MKTPLPLLALFALAACGGSSEKTGSPPPPPDGLPTATLTAPAALAANLAGTVTLAADASDDLGVAAVEFQVDGATVGSDTTAPYTFDVDTNGYASGQHVVRARARDVSGNVSAWSAATVQFGGTRSQGSGFTRSTVVTGLTAATAFAQAPDGRFFVAEQGGRLRIVKNGALLPAPFVQLVVDSSGERGLLGVALHPGFASNQLVYLHHTTIQGGTHNRISSFVANGDVAAANTETARVDLPALSGATNHNGGAIHFGPDGKLYAGVGDNANGAKAQTVADPFGKVLRFNDDGSVPSDNPFCTTNTVACGVWAYGLRNPFTFAFQPGTGRLHVNDVGQSTWEEVNVGARGANFGWPNSEGPDNVGTGITGPLFAYGHGAAASATGTFLSGVAIAGGAFYPDAGPFPASHRGHYFFADFGSGFVARLDLANNAVYSFGSVAGNPVDMLVGLDGALYVLTQTAITRFSSP